MAHRRTEAEDCPVTQQWSCRCFGGLFDSSGERIMSLLVGPCGSSANRQLCRTWYQVLDISPDEQDPQVIEEAALRCSSHVRAYQLTRVPECTLLLNEIAEALIALLDPVRRREHDLSIGTPPSPSPPERRPTGRRDTPVSPALGEDTRVLPAGEGGTCDVKVVYRTSRSLCPL
jgi:hypothetical protein